MNEFMLYSNERAWDNGYPLPIPKSAIETDLPLGINIISEIDEEYIKAVCKLREMENRKRHGKHR